MYQANGMEARRKHRHRPQAGPENVPPHTEPLAETGRPDRRLRVVRVPGGFVFVEDEPATSRVRAIDQFDERVGAAMK